MIKRTQWSQTLLLSVGLLAVVPVKCNSILAKRNPAVDDEYEYITVSNSLIPQRVKKGTKPVTTSPVEVYGGEGVRDMNMKHQNKGRLPTAGN